MITFFSRISLAVLVALFAIAASRVDARDSATARAPSTRLHAFYYPWYGNAKRDGAYSNWNHPVAVRRGPPRRFPGGDDIGANFYPAQGCYSSNSTKDVEKHMKQLERARVGVISVSWWGKGSFTDRALPLLFRAAEKHDIKICFHIEPHLGGKARDAATTRDALVYLLDRYGKSPALYRDTERGGRPMIYLYDSYKTEASEWATIFSPEGTRTIRGTRYDALIIGLWVKEHEERFMKEGHFDGFYTYFATEGFTFGSTPRNWAKLAEWARANDMLFIPCVAPGYIDTRIRPWNGKNTRAREAGAYYDRMFGAAIGLNPDAIGITSFNEWHEGTQIEPAAPKKIGEYTYEDYSPRPPEYYLDRTAHWAKRYESVLEKTR